VDAALVSALTARIEHWDVAMDTGRLGALNMLKRRER
jgi:NADPH-dependent 2,4-dienoyl-CoA reductase/sulfur reductase-like enzyme